MPLEQSKGGVVYGSSLLEVLISKSDSLLAAMNVGLCCDGRGWYLGGTPYYSDCYPFDTGRRGDRVAAPHTWEGGGIKRFGITGGTISSMFRRAHTSQMKLRGIADIRLGGFGGFDCDDVERLSDEGQWLTGHDSSHTSPSPGCGSPSTGGPKGPDQDCGVRGVSPVTLSNQRTVGTGADGGCGSCLPAARDASHDVSSPPAST